MGFKAGLIHPWLLGGIILFGGCLPYHIVDGLNQPVSIADSTIERDTLWQGTIIVDGVVNLPAGIILTLAPGTRVEFTYRDSDQDGIGESGIYVNGRLIAEGTKEQNIVFTSHTISAKPAAWGEVKIEYSLESKFKFCRFEYADWGLHLHFSNAEVSYSVFEHNVGGLRFRSGPVNISHNLIQHNRIGLRFIHSEPIIEYNTISNNLTGIFIRERVRRPRITHNNIAQNKDYNLKLGEAQHYSLNFPDNWWGSTQIEVIEKYIYDQQDEDYIGRINYTPIATQAW